jgi:hypothetical protein
MSAGTVIMYGVKICHTLYTSVTMPTKNPPPQNPGGKNANMGKVTKPTKI